MRAPYAADPNQTRGRLYPETESKYRSPFQRDRDRVIHSSAFRRLKHKTQVFVEHEGDYFRTRLTHSIEVAQVARTIAGVLGLNEALTETVALAHDLGHPPFGHTGEDALNALMQPFGGFDHNAHTLKLVTSLEQHYADFDGLNLTWETLEGLAKHNGPVQGPIPYEISAYCAQQDLDLSSHASGEAQVAALADDIAYNHHDIQDGLRARLFNVSQLRALPMVGPAFDEVAALYPDLPQDRFIYEALRRVFGVMVEDVIETSQDNLTRLKPGSADDLRNLGTPVIRFSEGFFTDLKSVRSFLFENMYRADPVMQMRERVTRIVRELFEHFMENANQLPLAWQQNTDLQDETAKARIISDYIAGMTDRYALQEHARLIGGESSTIARKKVL